MSAVRIRCWTDPGRSIFVQNWRVLMTMKVDVVEVVDDSQSLATRSCAAGAERGTLERTLHTMGWHKWGREVIWNQNPSFLPGGHATAGNLLDASSFSSVSFCGLWCICTCLVASGVGVIRHFQYIYIFALWCKELFRKKTVWDKSCVGLQYPCSILQLCRASPQGTYTFGVASGLACSAEIQDVLVTWAPFPQIL